MLGSVVRSLAGTSPSPPSSRPDLPTNRPRHPSGHPDPLPCDNWDMNELLTAGLTVFGGAVVLVVGQIIQRIYLEPIHEQRRIIGEIAYALIYDANVVREGVTKERAEETVTRLHRLASSLRATVPTIPSYAFFARQGWVPPADNVMRASTQLIGWSNGLSYRGEEGVQHRR